MLLGWFSKIMDALRRTRAGSRLPQVHSVPVFQAVFDQQKVRAERSGRPLSMAVFRLPPGETEDSPPVAALLDALSRRKRCFDEIGWLDGSSIGVLLPDTPLAGARLFAESAAARAAWTEHGPPPYELYAYPAEEDRAAGAGGAPPAERRRKTPAAAARS
jgi:hypothetical protein